MVSRIQIYIADILGLVGIFMLGFVVILLILIGDEGCRFPGCDITVALFRLLSKFVLAVVVIGEGILILVKNC